MHELAVTESILDIASRHGQEAGASKVTDIYIVIGQISSVIDDSVQFYWDMISEDSICEGSTLHFQRVKFDIFFFIQNLQEWFFEGFGCDGFFEG